jgi:hypothetical protein
MDMFGLITKILNRSEVGAEAECNAVEALEKALLEHSETKFVDTASRLRNQLRRNNCHLSNEDKVRIVKALNKAKVRALMGGTDESFSKFRSLDSISSDVVSLL